MTLEGKTVAEYAGISLFELGELDVFEYWTLLHDAVIYNRAQTQEGRKWLKNAWRIAQKEPDSQKLHKEYG